MSGAKNDFSLLDLVDGFCRSAIRATAAKPYLDKYKEFVITGYQVDFSESTLIIALFEPDTSGCQKLGCKALLFIAQLATVRLV